MMERLREAFPDADEITTQTRDYGFRRGVSVRNGPRRHAISLDGRTLDEAIATLRKWGAK